MNRSEFMSHVIGLEQSPITEKYYEQMTENIFLPEGFKSEFAIFTSACSKPRSEPPCSIDDEKICELESLSICKPYGFVEIDIESPADYQSLTSSYDCIQEVCVVIGDVTELGQHVLVRCPGKLLKIPGSLTKLGDKWKIDNDVCPTRIQTTALRALTD